VPLLKGSAKVKTLKSKTNFFLNLFFYHPKPPTPLFQFGAANIIPSINQFQTFTQLFFKRKSAASQHLRKWVIKNPRLISRGQKTGQDLIT
jgi:hypothetical protein